MRLAEAEAALAILNDALATEPRSLMQRDSAILRSWLDALRQRATEGS
jgi:hypothetical protein